jgi:hypothetical protein
VSTSAQPLPQSVLATLSPLKTLRRAEKVASWIERYPTRSFLLLSAIYLVAVICLSWVKLLWLDELITLHIARLNSTRAILHALATGADPNPPVIHLAVMLCRRLFGEHALALRLPAILGYWIGMLSLFLFLKRRIPATWALAGVLLTLGMGGFEWSYESRSYAIFYGFTMLALLCWSYTTDAGSTRNRRAVFTSALAFSLAAALCTNYFSVLAFFPIAAGEFTRSLISLSRGNGTRSFRAPIWIALAVASLPLLVFRSFIRTSVALYQPYAWNKVSSGAIFDSYSSMVAEMLYPLSALLLLSLLVLWLGPICSFAPNRLRPSWLSTLASTRRRVGAKLQLTPPECAAVAVLVLYPFVGYVVASIHGGMLSPRFVIPVCLGMAIAGVLLAFHTFGHLRSAGTLFLLSACIWFAAREAYVGFSYEVQKESFFRVIGHIPEVLEPDQPIVVADNLLVLPLRFYAPPQIASRIVYPIDIPAIMRQRGEASAEINLWTGRDLVYDFKILPIASVQQGTGTYPIITGQPDWIVDDLRRHFYDTEPLPVDSEAAGLDTGTTPLSHGKPYFYWSDREQYTALASSPRPFDLAANVPELTPKRRQELPAPPPQTSVHPGPHPPPPCPRAAPCHPGS